MIFLFFVGWKPTGFIAPTPSMKLINPLNSSTTRAIILIEKKTESVLDGYRDLAFCSLISCVIFENISKPAILYV